MATVSALDAVSMGATGKIAKAVGKGQKISKSAMYLKVTTSLLSNTLSFGKNTSMAGENLHKMYNKYIAGGHTFDWNDSETRAECYNLCLNLFGMALSGSGMSRDTSKLSRMLEADGVERALRNKISNVLSGGRKSGSRTLDNRLVNNTLFNNGERVATTKQIRNYKKQMKGMGINVVVDKKGKVLNGNKVAGFDYSTGTI
ncbi:MAG: zincin-like metallopeptidase toxin domain-containing protein [Acetatifactor sp.]